MVEYHKNHLFTSGNSAALSQVAFSGICTTSSTCLTSWTATDVFNVETLGKIHRIAKELYLMPQTIPGQVISIASRSRVKDTITSYDEAGYPMVSIKGYHVLAERVAAVHDATAHTVRDDRRLKVLCQSTNLFVRILGKAP